MKSDKLRRGLTLIEMVVVLAIFLMIAFLTVPQVLGMINRAKIEGTAREVAILMRVARLEAIKRSCYGVVMIDPAQRKFIAFADMDRDGLLDTTRTPPDIVLGAIDLPKMLDFKDELGNTGLASVKGLENPDPLPDSQVMYREDGSALSLDTENPGSAGKMRIADQRGNVLEVYVAQTSGKIQIRKHQGTGYFAKSDREWTYQ